MKKSAPKRASKKALKPLDVHTNNDVKRYIGAVTEHFEGHVSAVAEQFVGLNEKIDAFREEIKETLDSHTQTIGNLSEDVEIIKTNVEFLKSALQAKVDYQDFSALEKRVRLVEEKLHRS